MPGIVTGGGIGQPGTGTPQTLSREQIIAQQAQTHHIPVWVLWGVYGLETSYGKNVKTSSTGAMGPFQFEPQTAQLYGYPMTNNPSDSQFTMQAAAAASYLHDLFFGNPAKHIAAHGNWDNALHAYSGGGYGEQQAHKAGTTGQEGQGINNAIQSTISTIGDVVTAPVKLFDLLTNPQTWLRLAEMILGGALLLMGLRSMTGASNDPVQLARMVAR